MESWDAGQQHPGFISRLQAMRPAFTPFLVAPSIMRSLELVFAHGYPHGHVRTKAFRIMKMVFLPPQLPVHLEWVERLRAAYPNVEFAVPTDRDAALQAVTSARAAFGRLDPDLLAAASQIEWLQAPFAAPPAGFYFDELTAHPASVTNFRGIYNDHISYHILGLMMSFTKHFHEYRDLQRDRRWHRLNGPGYNEVYLPEATALIVGAGGIGIETARLLKAIGMRVIATDARRTKPSPHLDELHAAEQLDALLPAADFVIVTIPHTPSTEGMFDAAKFALMKPSGIFINIGRGMTTRLDDLNTALRDGTIRGAGLDVFEIEPLPTEHPLWDAPNTILTPHIAVEEAAYLDERRYEVVHQNIGRFLRGEALHNLVDKANWF